MNIRLLFLAAPFFFGAACGAYAAPHTAKAAKAAPGHRMRPAPSVAAGPFRDVPPDHWAARAVETLRRKGIVRGYPGAAKEVRAR